jgi:hypothetical protein
VVATISNNILKVAPSGILSFLRWQINQSGFQKDSSQQFPVQDYLWHEQQVLRGRVKQTIVQIGCLEIYYI